MLSRFSSKSDVNKGYRCMVRLLDDQEEIMECEFQGHHPGQYLLDDVCGRLNLLEKDFFGLRFVDEYKQRHWMDPTKVILKQVKAMNPIVFCFRVKHYPKDPHRLTEEITRYHVYLQLRRDLLHGRLYCSPDDAALLGAYIVQSELGDYDPAEHLGNYISSIKILLRQTAEVEQKMMSLHQTAMQGQVPAIAEVNFLRKACMLDTYGIDPHPVKDNKGEQMYLGINFSGILTFQGSRKTHHFRWQEIHKLNFEGKMFIIHLTFTDRKRTVGFKCTSSGAARHLWRCAVEQRLFFTLRSSREAPAVITGGSFFSRGTKLRYSGRTEKEILEHAASVGREQPSVRRSSSFCHRPSVPYSGPLEEEEPPEEPCGYSPPVTSGPPGLTQSPSDGPLSRARPAAQSTNQVPSNTPYANSAPTSVDAEKVRSEQTSKEIAEIKKRLPSGERRHSDVTGARSASGFNPAMTPEPELYSAPRTRAISSRFWAVQTPSGSSTSMSKRFLRVCPMALFFSVIFVLGTLLLVLELDNEALRPLRESHEMELLTRNYYLPFKNFVKRNLVFY